MIPPPKLSGNFTVRKWIDAHNKLVDYLVSLTPRQGHGTTVHHSTQGTTTNAKGQSAIKDAPSTLSNRGDWAPDQQYEENDIVVRRHSAFGDEDPRTLGTFWCVRDHTSTIENMPRERTPFEQDPVSGGETDLWRTLAVGAFERFFVRAFPILSTEGGPTVDLTTYTLLLPASVNSFSNGGGHAGFGAEGGEAKGESPGAGKWSLKASELPQNEEVKFRQAILCINQEKFTVWIPMSDPKPVA